ncbi:hypothetical protein SOVF_210710 [Spinacia oleracea]|nr:hypothetical protein SOVF_210710 [Spinacia oleracea]
MDRNSDSSRSFRRGIDVNRPAGGDDEDAGVHPRTAPSRGLSDDEDGEVERASFRGCFVDDEDGGENKGKIRLTKDQSAILRHSFEAR